MLDERNQVSDTRAFGVTFGFLDDLSIDVRADERSWFGNTFRHQAFLECCKRVRRIVTKTLKGKRPLVSRWRVGSEEGGFD